MALAPSGETPVVCVSVGAADGADGSAGNGDGTVQEAVLHATSGPMGPLEVVIRLVVEVQAAGGSRTRSVEPLPTAPGRQGAARSAGARREVTFAWSAEAVAHVRDAHRRLRREVEGLTLSALVSAAIEVALEDPGAWLGTVEDDLRRSRLGHPRRQISVQLPDALVARFQNLWDRLEAMSADIWGDGFRLTKAHLALAGIEYSLASAEDSIIAALGRDVQ